ncbi:hypothetical protein [Vibrio cyclitrophicus]|nr:hypothetical protein [Vibrio cyclitrophicus]
MQSANPTQDNKKDHLQAKLERYKQKKINQVSELTQKTINGMLSRER